MLEQLFDKLITKSKFQKASIFTNYPSQILVTLGTQVDNQNVNDYDQKSEKYSYQSYVSLGEDSIYQLKNQRIFDIRTNNESMQNMVVFQEDNKYGIDTFNKALNGINQSNRISYNFQECKMINRNQLLDVNEQRKKIEFINITDRGKSEQWRLYDISPINQYGYITTLHLLSDQRALFNVGCQQGDHFANCELKCLDIEAQQIQWQESLPPYNHMMSKIINISRTTFLQGCSDRQQRASLRLYDRRIKGPILNVLHSDLQVWQRLSQRWTGRGTIRGDYDNICKHPNEFIMVGMFSFHSGFYNFPYIMDLRRPGTIIPLNFPDKKHLSHLKCFEMADKNIVALEREYLTYTFKQARLYYYQITNE